MRRSPAVTAALAILGASATLVALSGCTGISLPGLGGGCAAAYESGEASDLVTAPGEFAGDPESVFPTPLIAPAPEVTVLEEGTGDPLPDGGTARLSFSVYDGETGEPVQAIQRGLLIAGDLKASFSRSIECTKPGARLVLVTSAADASSTDLAPNQANPYFVVVIDILETWLGKANGINQLPIDGMPTVVTAVNGEPGVVVPAQDAPTEHQVATIKAGGGTALAEGDVAVLHIRSWGWPGTIGSRPVVDVDTWTTAPALTQVADDNEYGPVFADALRGAKVGSQLLIVLTADEAGGVATIYVVDILGTSDPVYTGATK